jgi:hypothetical protein
MYVQINKIFFSFLLYLLIVIRTNTARDGPNFPTSLGASLRPRAHSAIHARVESDVGLKPHFLCVFIHLTHRIPLLLSSLGASLRPLGNSGLQAMFSPSPSSCAGLNPQLMHV